MTNRKPSIAVIGSGYWGKNLVRNYHQLGALRLICDKDESTLVRFKDQYPETEACLGFTDVLRREDIHGVVIATPAETHFVLIREALLAGKHVYVEKPLVLHENEATELISLAEERELIIMVGHLLQYHPAFLQIKELVAGGKLGRINYICSHRLNLGKIRREENILWSFAPHDISMILSLVGEEPESVSATGGNYLHQKIADVTTTHLEFPSGLKAHIFVSWLHPFKEQKLVVVGDRKMAVFDDTKPWPDKLLLYSHKINWQDNVPIPAKAEPEVVDMPEEEPLRLECEHFLWCIANSQTPRTDGHEGLRVLRILNASQRSLDQNGEKIYLTEASKEELSHKSYEQGAEVQGAFVHPTAIVDENVTVETGTKIWHFSHVMTGSEIGENCNLGQNVVVSPDVVLGNNVKVQNNVSIYTGVICEDDVFLGPSMVFTNVINPRSAIVRREEYVKTVVEKGATIGANATIVCGNNIGKFSFIGAGAVVTREVKAYALVVGNPSRQVGWMSEFGHRLEFDNNGTATCPESGEHYLLDGDRVTKKGATQ